MINEKCKTIAHNIKEESKKRNLITKYKDWCKTDEAKEYALTEEEINYYITKFERGGKKDEKNI